MDAAASGLFDRAIVLETSDRTVKSKGVAVVVRWPTELKSRQ